jgi:hypothetical protein
MPISTEKRVERETCLELAVDWMSAVERGRECVWVGGEWWTEGSDDAGCLMTQAEGSLNLEVAIPRVLVVVDCGR